MATLRSYNNIFPFIDKSVYIDSTAVLIGDIKIKTNSSIWPFVAIRGDVNHIRIGSGTNIQDGSVLHVTHKSIENPKGFPLLIGNNVTIGHKVMLHGCTINDRVLVGMGSIILDGVIIEDEVMIGAGSLIPPNKRLNTGYLYLGNPVKKIRLLTKKERTFLTQSAKNYIKTKNEYLTTVFPV